MIRCFRLGISSDFPRHIASGVSAEWLEEPGAVGNPHLLRTERGRKDLGQKTVVDEGGEYLITGFEGTGEGASDLRDPDPLAIANRNFTHGDSLFRGFELHLDCPSEGFVLHVQREELRVPDRSEGT